MEQSSSYDELTIRHQFDRICHLALEGEAVNYYRHMDYRRKHEVCLSELSEKELSRLFTMDQYEVENYQFRVLDYDIEVKDSLIAEALQILTEKKRNVILLSYFMGMSDAEIAREMSLVRSTIHEHRTRSLEMLKKIMEEYTEDEKPKA
ncbi:MAG: sigma factor-like helix-turn-helix DNA-binding protein [Lachnospiraceae bacterium]